MFLLEYTKKPLEKTLEVSIRTKEGPIRTISQIPIKLKVPCHQTLPIHEILAPKIQELKAKGMTNRDIALRLKIDRKTVAKGLLSSLL